jgi:hypothetical protein
LKPSACERSFSLLPLNGILDRPEPPRQREKLFLPERARHPQTEDGVPGQRGPERGSIGFAAAGLEANTSTTPNAARSRISNTARSLARLSAIQPGPPDSSSAGFARPRPYRGAHAHRVLDGLNDDFRVAAAEGIEPVSDGFHRRLYVRWPRCDRRDAAR